MSKNRCAGLLPYLDPEVWRPLIVLGKRKTVVACALHLCYIESTRTPTRRNKWKTKK